MDNQNEAKPAAGSDKPKSRARGIDRFIHILNFVHAEGRPMRINEIARGIGAPRSSVYEIAERLVEEGLLEVFDEDGRVFLGRRLYYFGLAYANTFDLTREAKKHLAALVEKTGETSQLCMMDGNKYTIVMMRHGARPYTISSTVGESLPLPWTASGRLLLSDHSAEDIRTLVPAEDFALPDGRALSVDDFVREAGAAGEAGFCSCDTTVDSYTHCFSASVFDERNACVATLCLVVPREDANARYDSLKAALLDEARALSRSLGGRHPADR